MTRRTSLWRRTPWAALALLAAGCGQGPPTGPDGTSRAATSPAVAASSRAAGPAAAMPVGPAPRGRASSTDLASAPRPIARPPGPVRRADFGSVRASADARITADWVVDSADSQGLPFIIVDKPNARVLAFGADGRLRGASPALLGLARGDDSVPGIGERPIADIRPEERTTPAGRFAAEMGRNANGEDILWVSYDDAISMHRVRPTNPAERRLQRLASRTAGDNRISYGCINLPAKFYDGVVKPLFSARNGIVYVLPETRSARAEFGAYEVDPLHIVNR